MQKLPEKLLCKANTLEKPTAPMNKNTTMRKLLPSPKSIDIQLALFIDFSEVYYQSLRVEHAFYPYRGMALVTTAK